MADGLETMEPDILPPEEDEGMPVDMGLIRQRIENPRRHGDSSTRNGSTVLVRREERANLALQMRSAGATFAEIGKALGVSRQRANNIVRKELTKLAVENTEMAERLRVQEGIRLDRLQRAIWTDALKGDLGAVNTVLKIMEQRARLMGINKPAEQERETAPEAEAVKSWAELARKAELEKSREVVTAVVVEEPEDGGEGDPGGDEDGDDAVGSVDGPESQRE